MFTTTLSQANCRKVFVQRDFSESRVVRFASRSPVELEGKIDRQLYDARAAWQTQHNTMTIPFLLWWAPTLNWLQLRLL